METIILAIITFVLGYFTGVYLPQKFRKEDAMPKVSISGLQERQNYFDITNHGGDVLNFKIKISWLQDGVNKTRDMDKFFNFDEDPALGHPHNSSSLKKGETKKVINCPLYSENGLIKISVVGNDINDRVYEESLTLKNNNL